MSLSKLVLSLPIERAGFAILDMSPEVELCFPHMGRMALHYVLKGQLEFDAPDQPHARLSAGDFVCIARGSEHRLMGLQASRRMQTTCLRKLELAEEPQRLRFGRGGERGATILSASLNVLRAPGTYTVPILPNSILLRAGAQTTASFLPPSPCEEALTGAGASAFAAGLMQTLLSQAIRTALMESMVGQQPDVAFRFPRVASAHRLMERNCGEPWTIDSLAAAAGMAKSTFVAAFTAAIGEPPSSRLTKIRLSEAQRLLASSRAVGDIAAAVGYRSQAAFTRAFRRQYGETPSAVRQRLGQFTESGERHTRSEASRPENHLGQ